MTPTAFLAYWPEFAGAVADDVQRALDKAAPYFNVIRWGSSYAEGIANLAAHFYVGDRARRARAAAVSASSAVLYTSCACVCAWSADVTRRA